MPLVAARLPAGHEAHDLQLLVSLDGRAVVAWIDRQDGVGTAVRAARLGAARPTVSTIAVAHRGRVGLDGLIAVGNAAGRATLVWRDRSNGAHLRSATLAGWNQRWAVADGPAGVDVTDAFRGVLSADLTGTVTGAWRVGRQVVVALRDATGAGLG